MIKNASRTSRRSGALLVIGAAAFALGGGCFYAPALEEGQFTCRDGDCPPGFVCSEAPAYQCVTDLANVRFDGAGDVTGTDGDTGPGPDALPDGNDGPDGPVGNCSPDKLEPNNDQVNARAIGPGTNLPAGIPSNVASLCTGDQDWYRITLETQGLLVRMEASSVRGLVLELRDVGGEILARGNSEPGEKALVISDRALSPGTYFARVSGVPPSQGVNYGLAIGSPPHDRCEGASPLTAGGAAVTDDFSRAQHDYDPGALTVCTGQSEDGLDLTYQLTLNAPRRVVIEADGHGDPAVDPSPSRASSDLSLFLLEGNTPEVCLDAETTCIAGSTTRAALGRGDDPYLDLMLDTGRYYLVVSNRASQAKPYIRLSYDLDARCVMRADCPSDAPGFCGRDHRCQALSAAFAEIDGSSATGNPLPLDIPDGDADGTPGVALYDLNVDQFVSTARVTELQVGIDLRHTWRGDLRVIVRGPPDPQNGGDRAMIMLYDRGGNQGQDFGNHIVELFGSDQALGQAVGVPASGPWTVEIMDMENGEVGQVRDVRLFIKAE